MWLDLILKTWGEEGEVGEENEANDDG